MMEDEEFYLEATNEVDNRRPSPAIWAKAMALAEGDPSKAKYTYIKLRVEHLKQEFVKKEEADVSSAGALHLNEEDHAPEKHISIEEYCQRKGLDLETGIERIREGVCEGRKVDGRWYIHEDAVEAQEVVEPPPLPYEHPDYLPVEEFAEFKGLATRKAIYLIRQGLYQGRLIDGKWYVNNSEFHSKSSANRNTEGGTTNWYLEVLKKYAVFDGRARRKEYWYFFLFSILITFAFMFIDAATGTLNPESGFGILSGIYTLAVFLPSIAVVVRRLHDTNRSGFWLLLMLVPVIGLVLLIFLVFDSDPEENEYGPNPKAEMA
jgi:uncharacterized membrane protein YhaH (DUF805 family)